MTGFPFATARSMPGFCHLASVTADDDQYLDRFEKVQATYYSSDPYNTRGRAVDCPCRDSYSGGNAAGWYYGQTGQT